MQIRRTAPVAAALAGMVLLTAANSAESQVHRYGAGWTVGGTYVTDLNIDATTGEGVSPTPIAPGLGFTLGLHLEKWYGSSGKMGVRYQGSYQQPRVEWTGGQKKIDVVSADVSVLYRFTDPAVEGAVLPYLTLGVGGIWYDLGRGRSLTFNGADAFYDGAGRVLPMVAFGIGADVPAMWNWTSFPVKARFEVADHLTIGSPLKRQVDQSRHGPVHHVQFTVGLYSAVW
jgi:hypothetical protein